MAVQEKVRWGVLGAAGIALKKVIPAMQKCERATVYAIASRDLAKAQDVARAMAIPKAYGSYEKLLADPEVQAIYNPLPNHLHVPWSIRAAHAGKHVLCEKPVALTAAEAKPLLDVRNATGVKIGEAFMVRVHPQWLRARELVRSGAIGELRAFSGFFSYANRNPKNIRNILEYGGGGLMDIGCYPINTSRFVFGAEPDRVLGLLTRDPAMRIDTLTSAILDFEGRHATFTCSTQLVPYQRVQILGTTGRIEIEIPFNAPMDRPTRIVIDTGADLFGGGSHVEEFPICDQYTLQGDAFSRAIQEGGEVPVPLEDAIANMAVIEAVFRSGESGQWERPL
ncbi:MAG: Gfo/Idh/MocA family protein [Bryobacteraceae bacterium]